jgi:hypothetical protein
MRCREKDSLVGRDVIRACCQWQPQLSKKRDFFPSMVPHEHVPYSLRNRDQGERNKTCPRLLSGPGHDRGTDRNRRATTTLSPILYLFQLPSSTLYQKLQKVLSEVDVEPLPEQRRPGPRAIPSGIPEHEWQIVLARVANHEPYRAIAKDYQVSRETIRRLVQAAKQAS